MLIEYPIPHERKRELARADRRRGPDVRRGRGPRPRIYAIADEDLDRRRHAGEPGGRSPVALRPGARAAVPSGALTAGAPGRAFGPRRCRPRARPRSARIRPGRAPASGSPNSQTPSSSCSVGETYRSRPSVGHRDAPRAGGEEQQRHGGQRPDPTSQASRAASWHGPPCPARTTRRAGRGRAAPSNIVSSVRPRSPPAPPSCAAGRRGRTRARSRGRPRAVAGRAARPGDAGGGQPHRQPLSGRSLSCRNTKKPNSTLTSGLMK